MPEARCHVHLRRGGLGTAKYNLSDGALSNVCLYVVSTSNVCLYVVATSNVCLYVVATSESRAISEDVLSFLCNHCHLLFSTVFRCVGDTRSNSVRKLSCAVCITLLRVALVRIAFRKPMKTEKQVADGQAMRLLDAPCESQASKMAWQTRVLTVLLCAT